MFLVSDSRTRMNFSTHFLDKHLCPMKKLCPKFHCINESSFGETYIRFDEILGVRITNATEPFKIGISHLEHKRNHYTKIQVHTFCHFWEIVSEWVSHRYLSFIDTRTDNLSWNSLTNAFYCWNISANRSLNDWYCFKLKSITTTRSLLNFGISLVSSLKLVVVEWYRWVHHQTFP